MSAGGSNSEVQEQAQTWLLPEQVDALRDACLSEAVPTYLQDRDEALIALLYDLGLRRGEAAALDVADVDLERGTVYLPADAQKGEWAEDATLELGRFGADATRALSRYLDRRWKDPDALFPSRSSDRMTGKAIYDRVQRLAELADVRPRVVGGGAGDPTEVTPHTLRHSVAYRVLQVEEGRLEDVQARLRHKNLATTDRVYSHIIPR